MRIKKLIIKNYRCFGPEKTTVDLDDLTVFIGMNSSGKTAILQSFLLVFDKKELRRADFHVPHNKNPNEISETDLYIEAVIDFPELENDEPSAINTIPNLFRHMVVKGVGGSTFVRICLQAKWRKLNIPDGDIEYSISFINSSDFDEEIDESKLTRFTYQYKAMINVIYVPAIRNPSEQLRNVSGTLLSQLLNGVSWPEDIEEKIKLNEEGLNTIFSTVEGFSALSKFLQIEWEKLHNDRRYYQLNVGFTSADLNSVLKKLDVRFFPTEVGGDYSVNELGEGLRSLFYLSLVSTLLRIEEEVQKATDKTKFNDNFIPSALTILAIEEPENHIAPHLLGNLMYNLGLTSKQFNSQVVVTSHSPAIVKRIDPEFIRHMRINGEDYKAVIRGIKLPDKADEAHKYVKEAVIAYPEIYFARLVILGEGDTEEIILPKCFSNVDNGGISIVPLGGRHVNHFWKLLSQLEIPYISFLDLDLERNTGGWERIQNILGELIKTGVDGNQILEVFNRNGFIIDTTNLVLIKDWEKDREKIEKFVHILEEFDIFFATPLDMDFLMLDSFQEAYKSLAPKNGGPRLSQENSIQSTLKQENGDTSLFTLDEKGLMVWYQYLFLNRGKPSTHILALSKMNDDELMNNPPDVIRRLVTKARIKLVPSLLPKPSHIKDD